MKCTVISVNPFTFENSIRKAAEALKEYCDSEVTLSFEKGNYNLGASVVLDASEYYGSSHIRMIGDNNGTVFSSLREIPSSSFTAVEGKPYYVCSLNKNSDGAYPNLRTLYVNGKIADISRTGEYRSTPSFVSGDAEYKTNQSVLKETHKLYVPLDSVNEAGIENCAGAELHIRVEWEFKIYHIERIDADDNWTDENGKTHVAMYLCSNEKKNGNGSLAVYNRVFFICNTTSVLNTPGQYAYERAAGRLYYYPEADIADCRFEIGLQTSLFSFRNFDGVTLSSLTFTGVEDEIHTETGYYGAGQAGSWKGQFKEIFPHAGAVKIENVGRLDVDECTFTDLPCDGISLIGVLNNVAIRNSRFTDIGATAIRAGRPLPYSETDQINNINIVNNYLDNIGFTYENSCSILVTKVRDGKLNHNTVLRSSYSAFSLGWRWNVADWNYGEQVNLENVEVAYNYIRSFVMNMRDGGGVYTLGGNADISHAAFMNTLHDNYVIEDELTCPENGFFGSLYHDGASSNWYTYNNIVIHNPALNGTTSSYSARIYLQLGGKSGTASTEGQAAWHILCENNYICCCRNFGEIFRSQAVDPEKASNMLDITRDLREINTHMLPSAEALNEYPEAVRIMQFSGCESRIGAK